MENSEEEKTEPESICSRITTRELYNVLLNWDDSSKTKIIDFRNVSKFIENHILTSISCQIKSTSELSQNDSLLSWDILSIIDTQQNNQFIFDAGNNESYSI